MMPAPRAVGLFAALSFCAVPTFAQPAPWNFAVPQPAADRFTVTRDVPFSGSGADALKVDIYKPVGTSSSTAPVVIFFNSGRAHPFFTAWAQYAASRGFVTLMPDVRPAEFTPHFDALLAFLSGNGERLGLDSTRIAIYAPSGIVSSAFPAVQRPSVTAVKAAVIYYGAPPASFKDYRLDLPMLVVRAGLDRPGLNRAMVQMASDALTQNAPVTFINNTGGYHSFETANHDEATRQVMDVTLEFVKRATSPDYQAALRRSIPEATAAAHVLAGRAKEAAVAYGQLVAARPDAHMLRLAYLEALLSDSQFAAACAEADKLRGKGLGPRDLGLPAARACMQKGDADAAIAWLKSIPQRFLPPDVQNDAVFAPLRARDDFKALFPPR